MHCSYPPSSTPPLPDFYQSQGNGSHWNREGICSPVSRNTCPALGPSSGILAGWHPQRSRHTAGLGDFSLKGNFQGSPLCSLWRSKKKKCADHTASEFPLVNQRTWCLLGFSVEGWWPAGGWWLHHCDTCAGRALHCHVLPEEGSPSPQAWVLLTLVITQGSNLSPKVDLILNASVVSVGEQSKPPWLVSLRSPVSLPLEFCPCSP